MKTRCPQCHTVYSVEQDALRASHDMARCYNCGAVFNALSHALDSPLTARPTDAQQPRFEPPAHGSASPRPGATPAMQTGDAPETLLLPFDVPDDLPTLQPSEDTKLDVQGTLHPRRSRRSPWWQKAFAILLVGSLGAQLAWFYRAQLLTYPQARPLCRWIDCSITQRRDPDAFVVIERQMHPDTEMPEALSLKLRFRNTADFAQPLPRLQLSLLDSNGIILARRLFTPRDYLFPATAGDSLAQAQEVITIELLFEDPGVRASGFRIGFL